MCVCVCMYVYAAPNVSMISRMQASDFRSRDREHEASVVVYVLQE